MELDLWTSAIARMITVLLQLIGIMSCIGLIAHALQTIVWSALGGSGKAVADLVVHVIGVVVALGLALAAPRLVAALMASLLAGSLFG